MTSRRFWLLFGGLLALDVLKHALTFSIGPMPIVLDASEYWAAAGAAAAGDWLQLESTIAYRTPLYPLCLGVLRWAFGDNALVAAVVWQHLLVMATGWLAAHICWRITRRSGAALMGYTLCVLCLTRPWFANTLLNDTFFTFGLTATLAALVAYHQRPSVGRAAAWWGLLGLTILIRPAPQLLWVPLCGFCFYHATRWAEKTQRVRAIALHVAAGLATLAAVLSPWYVRNWIVFGEVFLARPPAVDKWQVCFQGGSGAHLQIPRTPAGERLLELIGTPDGDIHDRYMYAVVAALENRGLSEREIDALVSEVCRDAILEHPGAFAWSAFKRFVNFWRCVVAEYPYYAGDYPREFGSQRAWRFEPVARAYERILSHTPAQWLRWNEFAALACGIGTAVLSLRSQTRVIGLSLAATLAYFAAVIAVVGIENYRYRMVLEPAMIAAVVSGGYWLVRGPRQAESVTSAAPPQTPTNPTAAAVRGQSPGSPPAPPPPAPH